MAYTVKQLSELSGATVRTLHFYEEIGLLKPAYYGSNGYRYYEKKELLLLQQILFFKELGFSLKQIQKVIGGGDFDQLAALYSHQKTLRCEGEKIKRLLKTVDKTIEHLKGKIKIDDKEFFHGFNISLVALAKGRESYFSAEALVLKSIKSLDVKKREKSFYENIIKTTHAIFDELVQCIEKGLDCDSEEVQRIIKKHYVLAGKVHLLNRSVYRALAQLYVEHPEFRKQLDPFHPELASFMADAMKFFSRSKKEA